MSAKQKKQKTLLKNFLLFYYTTMENKEKVFLLWGSDGEMAHIKKTLIENNVPYIDKWLGRWAKVEDYADEIQQLMAEGKQPVAIELTGAGEGEYANVMSIDHHGERAHEKAAILQVLDVLWVDATLEDRLVAANDNAYIPGMKKVLEEEWITDIFEQEKMIRNIRFKDRQAQGITEEQEQQAQEAVNHKEKILDGKLTIVALPHSKCATVTDRLFGQYQNLLVLSWDGEVNFYGDGKLCADLKERFEGRNGWSWLGNAGENAFRWGYPNHEEIHKFVTEEIEKGQIFFHLTMEGNVLKLKFGCAASNDKIVPFVEQKMKAMIENKEIPWGELVKIDGPASLPVAAVIAHKLAHLYSVVAVFDPKLQKFVVAISHSDKNQSGDLIA
jgi:CRISPR-associated protein Csx3